MTVTTTANSISYAGNGTTTAFAFPYIFFEPADLVVTLSVTATNAAVTPPPVLGGAATYDYTVTGDSSGGEYPAGGTITFNTAPLSEYTVLIVRAVAATQDIILIDNTKFPAATVNTGFDKLTVLAQQAAFLSGVSLQIPSYEIGVIVTAAPAASRANKLLLWDAAGNLSTIDTANIIGGSVPAGPAAGDLAGTYPAPTIKASVGLTGTPTSPTAAAGTSTTQIASTAFVGAAILANGFRLLQRTVVSSAVANVNIQGIASDINSLKFEFDLTPTTTANDLYLQFYDNTGALDTTSTHYAWGLSQTYSNIVALAAPAATSSAATTITAAILLNYSGAGNRIRNSDAIRGSGTIANIRTAGRVKGVHYQSNYMDEAGAIFRFVTGSGVRNQTTAITGIHLVFAAGTIASGAFSVWGSP